jgi:hypothetical protein
MGNHIMGHCHIQVNSASPRMSKATIAEIWKQSARIKVTQSPNVVVTTTRVEMVFAPN